MTDTPPPIGPRLSDLDDARAFVGRHVGPDAGDVATMLDRLGLESIDALLDAVVPSSIRDDARLQLPEARSETEVTAALRALADANNVRTSLIGTGWYAAVTPPVIRRNVLENPAWYTAYTPYQPEISQGRLEALLTYQTMVCDLTGTELTNASMLDEATAAAEGMALVHRVNPEAGSAFVVDPDTHPQTVSVVRTRAEPLGLDVVVAEPAAPLPEGTFGVLVSHPGSSGELRSLGPVIAAAHEAGALVVVATDLLACCVMTPPGELGADVVVGSSQRFGVPMGFGGPSAGFLATREAYKRTLPGRLVGVSVDAAGRPAYRLALQTREQHIRREKATSNICTAQVLLAVMAGMYAVWHGPEGLARIATRVHRLTSVLDAGLRAAGIEVVTPAYFDTLTVRVPGRAGAVLAAGRDLDLELRSLDDDHVGLSLDESSTATTVETVWAAFGITDAPDVDALDATTADALPAEQRRTSEFCTHPVFHTHRSETEMLRYLRRLADADLALDRAMIPLGSCTMKLNATTEMEPISWPGFADLHPYAPAADTQGYRTLTDDLERWLCEITGYDAVSLQPNAGSQGEFAGLLAIRAWHRSRGEDHRDMCLIPASAHGTNAASATMAGMRVAVVACDTDGNVDLDDLGTVLTTHADRVAALMITYPSTHGVFEEAIGEICAAVHDAGGQVYLDGANLNALVGVAKPGRFGADVSHLNLHKTFCIPHGGGGPGVGPVAVRSHLTQFLPSHPMVTAAGPTGADGRVAPIGAVSAAPWGSAGILPIPWAYVTLMGPDGLRHATEVAILSANYVARRLGDAYPILYSGRNGLVAHECILDLRPVTKATGITVDDVAKRLIDYGFHAPTMSFPVAGTLMVESTESESLTELDRFCDAMLAIRDEIDRVASGEWPTQDNPLVNAPHPAADVADDEWAHPYPRRLAGWPAGGTARLGKYWPPVSRIDGAYGDRNVVCSCPPVEAFADV